METPHVVAVAATDVDVAPDVVVVAIHLSRALAPGHTRAETRPLLT